MLNFFTGAFPTLFPYGKGGHLLPANERRVPISLETWAKWLLSHHSRRFVWKPYVVFIILGPTDFNSGSRVIQHSCTCYTTSFNGGDLHLEILSSSKRRDYERVQDVISSLHHDQLLAAARSLRSTGTTADPAIRILCRAVQTVASRGTEFFCTEERDARAYSRKLWSSSVWSAWWLTINPSDMNDPLVIRLAGVNFPSDMFGRSTAALRTRAATMNQRLLPIFFHKICQWRPRSTN